MKVLTLTEPWATLWALGAKTIETRSWPTNYRGWVAIHSAQGYPAYAREFARTAHVVGALESGLHNFPKEDEGGEKVAPGWAYNARAGRFPHGQIIGIAYLAACEETHSIVAGDPVYTLNDLAYRYPYDRQVPRFESFFGDYRTRDEKGKTRYGFWTTHIIPLLKPIPVSGYQRLWDTRTASRRDYAGSPPTSDRYDDEIMQELFRRKIELDARHPAVANRGKVRAA